MNRRIMAECVLSFPSQHLTPKFNSSRLQFNQEMQIGNSVEGLITLRLLRGINDSNVVEFQGNQDDVGLRSTNVNRGETLYRSLIQQSSLQVQVDETKLFTDNR